MRVASRQGQSGPPRHDHPRPGKKGRADTLTQTCPPGVREMTLGAHGVALSNRHRYRAGSSVRTQGLCQTNLPGVRSSYCPMPPARRSRTDDRRAVRVSTIGNGSVPNRARLLHSEAADPSSRCEASARSDVHLGPDRRRLYLGRPSSDDVHSFPGTYALRQEAQAPQDRHAQAQEAASQEPSQEEGPLGSGSGAPRHRGLSF